MVCSWKPGVTYQFKKQKIHTLRKKCNQAEVARFWGWQPDGLFPGSHSGGPRHVYFFLGRNINPEGATTMQLSLRQSGRAAVASVLAVLFFVPVDLLAQNHVVSPADLQKKVAEASQARQRNLQTVQQFLSTPQAEKAMKSAQLDPQQINTALSTLDN